MIPDFVLWVVLPVGTLILGFSLGIALTRYGLMYGYRDHLDKHFFSAHPDSECLFCREERPSRAGGFIV